MNKKKDFLVAAFILTVIFLPTVIQAQEGGMFSSYLVGTYDNREGYSTKIQVVNPTGHYIYPFIAFFDDNEKPLRCVQEKLSPNDLLEIDIYRYKLPAKFGVIKIASLKDKYPYPGMVGFQKQYYKDMLVAESNLASVPGEILYDEYKILIKACSGVTVKKK